MHTSRHEIIGLCALFAAVAVVAYLIGREHGAADPTQKTAQAAARTANALSTAAVEDAGPEDVKATPTRIGFHLPYIVVGQTAT